MVKFIIIVLTVYCVTIPVFCDVIDNIKEKVESNLKMITNIDCSAKIYIHYGENQLTNLIKLYKKGAKSRMEYQSFPYYTLVNDGKSSWVIESKDTNVTKLNIQKPAGAGGLGLTESPFKGFTLELNEVKDNYAMITGKKLAGYTNNELSPEFWIRVFLVNFINGYVDSYRDFNTNRQLTGSQSIFYSNINNVYFPVLISNTAYLQYFNQTGYININLSEIYLNQAIDDNLFIK